MKNSMIWKSSKSHKARDGGSSEEMRHQPKLPSTTEFLAYVLQENIGVTEACLTFKNLAHQKVPVQNEVNHSHNQRVAHIQ